MLCMWARGRAVPTARRARRSVTRSPCCALATPTRCFARLTVVF